MKRPSGLSKSVGFAILTAVIVTAFFVRGNGSKSPAKTDLLLNSVYLQEGYIVFFKPISGEPPTEDQKETLNDIVGQYITVIEHGLDGEITQRFDTLLFGVGFRLDYTDKVLRAFGSTKEPDDVEEKTFAKLYDFLLGIKGDELASKGIEMLLEVDKSASIQKQD